MDLSNSWESPQLGVVERAAELRFAAEVALDPFSRKKAGLARGRSVEPGLEFVR